MQTLLHDAIKNSSQRNLTSRQKKNSYILGKTSTSRRGIEGIYKTRETAKARRVNALLILLRGLPSYSA